MSAKDTIGVRITHARSTRGWSQSKLAELSGVAAAQISRYEVGKATPRSEVVAKLARTLGVPFNWLLSNEGASGFPDISKDVPEDFAEVSTTLDAVTFAALKADADAAGVTIGSMMSSLVEQSVTPGTWLYEQMAARSPGWREVVERILPVLSIPWAERLEGFEQVAVLRPKSHQLRFALQGSNSFRQSAQKQLSGGRTSALLDGQQIVLQDVIVSDPGDDLPLICDANYESHPKS